MENDKIKNFDKITTKAYIYIWNEIIVNIMLNIVDILTEKIFKTEEKIHLILLYNIIKEMMVNLESE